MKTCLTLFVIKKYKSKQQNMPILCIRLTKNLSKNKCLVLAQWPRFRETYTSTLFYQHFGGSKSFCNTLEENCWHLWNFKIKYSNSNNIWVKEKRRGSRQAVVSEYILPWLKPQALLQNFVHIVFCSWWLFTLLGFLSSQILFLDSGTKELSFPSLEMMQGTCL